MHLSHTFLDLKGKKIKVVRTAVMSRIDLATKLFSQFLQKKKDSQEHFVRHSLANIARVARKTSFANFADFSWPFLALSLFKSGVLLNLLLWLFLRYLQVSVSHNFLLIIKLRKQITSQFLLTRSILLHSKRKFPISIRLYARHTK